MKKSQLEHILRAASAITGGDRFVVIGSHAILAQHPDPPPELGVSIEVDIFSLRSPAEAELIDGGNPDALTEQARQHRLARLARLAPTT